MVWIAPSHSDRNNNEKNRVQGYQEYSEYGVRNNQRGMIVDFNKRRCAKFGDLVTQISQNQHTVILQFWGMMRVEGLLDSEATRLR
jgi:hypothetical protein